MTKVTRPSVYVTVRQRVFAKPNATATVRDVKNTRRLPRLILSRIAKTMESATVALNTLEQVTGRDHNPPKPTQRRQNRSRRQME